MKIKLSALISDARGKLNGSYISRDNSGHVLRNKMSPTGTASIAQVRNRIAFQYIARRWDAITEQCRNEWRAYALTQPYKNIFGDTRYLSGIAMFIKTNLNHYISDRPLEDCPTIDVVIFPPLDWIVAPPTSDSLWLTLELPPTFQHVLLVYATPQMNVGVDSRKKEFALIVRLTAGDFHNNKVNLIDKYEAVFGKLENGRAISLMIRQASTSGKVSLPQYKSVVSNTIVPVFVGTSWRYINNNTGIAISAVIENAPIPNTEPYYVQGAYSEGYMQYPNDPTRNLFGPALDQQIYNGEEVELGPFDFSQIAITYGFIMYNSKTHDEKIVGITIINPSDFPEE